MTTELFDLIGQGTYGSVYRGACRGEDVAVKVMKLPERDPNATKARATHSATDPTP